VRESAISYLSCWESADGWYEDFDQWLLDWGVDGVEIVEATPDQPGPYRLWIRYFFQDGQGPSDCWLDKVAWTVYDYENGDEYSESFDVEARYVSYEEAIAARDHVNDQILESRFEGDFERMDHGEYATPKVIVRALS
jgi:hypothetical protein